MKLYFLSVCLLFSTIFISAQAYEGRGDQKFQVGANLQGNGTGIMTSYDYGLGENISIGATGTYLLGIEEEVSASTKDRFDLKARFSAHLGSIIGLSDEVDIYPGLDLGLKNFGFHTGARYFFSDGLGIYTEIGFPIAKYKIENLEPADKLHNQFNVNIGAVFNFL
ncbi:DUF6646 family protein [Zobellia uliginosa]|uniref:DUF6646 family protein n=1 Tax=Zobellia uliginosa TaxID=143224 RepID=UPI001C0759CA|nr:DUF6646 family protein [Zobellia uliginosa]MBU2948569.1 hypothetical protein [Zobellia uliginosa]